MTIKELFWSKGSSYYLTDKDTHHNYLNAYSELFGKFEKEPIILLEVGVYKGGSLRLFEEYFVNASIIGYDIKDWGPTQCKRAVRIIKDFGAVSASELPDNITIAIEDGAHDLDSQFDFVRKVYPKMASGGIMVIEDIFTHQLQSMKQRLDAIKISYEIASFFHPKTKTTTIFSSYENYRRCLSNME
jgi:hypothetical protein